MQSGSHLALCWLSFIQELDRSEELDIGGCGRRTWAEGWIWNSIGWDAVLSLALLIHASYLAATD